MLSLLFLLKEALARKNMGYVIGIDVIGLCGIWGLGMFGGMSG